MNRFISLFLAVLLSSSAWVGTAKAANTLQDTLMVSSNKPRVKAQGYRIQIYSGNNGRKSKNDAYKAGEVAHRFFPELSVYCRYKEPRWTCRVGDFPTMEAALHYLNYMKNISQFQECHIVKCQVLLPLHAIPKNEND